MGSLEAFKKVLLPFLSIITTYINLIGEAKGQMNYSTPITNCLAFENPWVSTQRAEEELGCHPPQPSSLRILLYGGQGTRLRWLTAYPPLCPGLLWKERLENFSLYWAQTYSSWLLPHVPFSSLDQMKLLFPPQLHVKAPGCPTPSLPHRRPPTAAAQTSSGNQWAWGGLWALIGCGLNKLSPPSGNITLGSTKSVQHWVTAAGRVLPG